jgi:hypothetical protein
MLLVMMVLLLLVMVLLMLAGHLLPNCCADTLHTASCSSSCAAAR